MQSFSTGFYDTILKHLLLKRQRFGVVEICDKFSGFIPICDPAHLLRKVFTFMINNDCVINHSI